LSCCMKQVRPHAGPDTQLRHPQDISSRYLKDAYFMSTHQLSYKH